MSHGIYDRCLCGHRYPEHTMFGTCHGCLNCTEDVVVDSSGLLDSSGDEEEHPYRQCDCRAYVLGERGEPSEPSGAFEPSGTPEDY
jgi:hypothetical protein